MLHVKDIENMDLRDLVCQTRSFEKCRKCECMSGTLQSLRSALETMIQDEAAMGLLLEVKENQALMLPAEYT